MDHGIHRATSTDPLALPDTPDFSLLSLLRRNFSTQTLGKISIFVLLLGSMTSQLKQQQPHGPVLKGSSSSLGSAAISSVTDALFPILPFAGGMDLRKEDYWSTGTSWWEHVQGVVVQVSEAFSSSNVDSSLEVDQNSAEKTQRKGYRSKNSKPRPLVISAPKPFVSLEAIGDLTLSEVGQFFRYAMESTRTGFDRGLFHRSVSPRVAKVIEAMDKAVDQARGPDAANALITPVEGSFGQVDALKFAAAQRIFAEWRVIRQVPEGYKGYSVGMSLGQKDVVQNLVKIEQGVHQWLINNPGERSPTLYQLLHSELEMGTHPRLPRLSEKSSAMGLLWVRRQMEYQTNVFYNVIQVPERFESGKEAIAAAYKQTYDRYHGWAVQKIFNYSFQAAPEPEKIYRHMNPHRLAEAKREAHHRNSMGAATRIPPAAEKSDSHPGRSDTDAPNKHPVIAFLDHVGGEWDKFADHVGGEWDKLAQNVVGVFDRDRKEGSSNQSQGTDSAEEVDAYITQVMVQDAQEQITSYLEVVGPLMQDLRVLFDNLNMDDPTKV